MPKCKSFILMLFVFMGACSDVIVAPTPPAKLISAKLILGYWVDSLFWHCPSNFNGLGDTPINGCVGHGLTQYEVMDTVSSDPTSNQVVGQTVEIDTCANPQGNRLNFIISLVTVADTSISYQIVVDQGTMLYRGISSDSAHLSGSITLAQSLTPIGTWKRNRLVPQSLKEETELAKLFDRSTFRQKTMSLAVFRRQYNLNLPYLR